MLKEKSPADEEQIKLIEEVEKKYNTKIEFVKFGDYNKYVENFTTTSLSGEPFADIVLLELFWLSRRSPTRISSNRSTTSWI
ncbi:hypothetical protein CM49_04908 [Paenibacillus sp. P1XP2]|nr:hypothetical protein CM49_04908 [Paenibacillus sp. P1XP2]